MLSFLGYQVFDSELSGIQNRKKVVVNTINPHSYCVAIKDTMFRRALLSSDILLPDGVGIVYASRILVNKKIKKISGMDLHTYLIERANLDGAKVFYLGASNSTLQKIKNKLNITLPNINVEAYSPPFKSLFSDNDTSEMIRTINAFAPDYLFVGMTAPKQEKWVYENKNKLNAKVICSIGAVFDFYSGNIKRSHSFWINLGLEWLPRFLKEPVRLFKRNLISSPKFILQVLWVKMTGKKLFKETIDDKDSS